MIPRTLSASSLQVAELCMDRWYHEYMNRAAQGSNKAAETGTAFHGGAERWVESVYIKREHEGMNKKQLKELLITFYMMSYIETFNTSNVETPEYKDGLNMTMKWFERTNFEDRTVISVEKKNTIPIPFNHPEGAAHKCEKCIEQEPGICVVPFNYIMDRVDQTGENEYEVVDYKTIRVPIQPEDLDSKLQARAYALALQIQYPSAERIKVTFDLIRHERIGIWVTREENISFWKFLCAELQRIVDMDASSIQPSINPECGYCVKKATCKLLQSNVDAGGIHSVEPDKAVFLIQDLKSRVKAQKLLIDNLEEIVMKKAAESGELAWIVEDPSGGNMEVEIGAGRGRQFDRQKAAEIMGAELFAQQGTMNLGVLDKLIVDESLPEETRKSLKSLIYWEQGNLSVKIKKKVTI